MTQTNIVIASVLKPLKDPRSYYRFAHSLRETNKYLINIIGFSTKKESDEKNIKFHPIFSKKRNHFTRIFAGWRFLKVVSQVKPQLVIITTYELLPAAMLGKWIIGFKLIYDIQENYALNLGQNKTQTGWKRTLAVTAVKFIESFSRRFIDHYFFAEKVYQEEFPKIKKFTILENKFFGAANVTSPIEIKNKKNLIFLISGTLTEVYGILEAIVWFREILVAYPQAILHIIGHTPVFGYKLKMEEASFEQESIRLRISDTPLPYAEIIQAYHESDIVLLPYHQIPSISPKVPSKLYESIALGKPCLFQRNPEWEAICSKYPSGKGIDFTDLSHASENLKEFLNTDFFVTSPGTEVLWKSEEQHFLNLIEKLIGQP
jgi:hypothetical protein